MVAKTISSSIRATFHRILSRASNNPPPHPGGIKVDSGVVLCQSWAMSCLGTPGPASLEFFFLPLRPRSRSHISSPPASLFYSCGSISQVSQYGTLVMVEPPVRLGQASREHSTRPPQVEPILITLVHLPLDVQKKAVVIEFEAFEKEIHVTSPTSSADVIYSPMWTISTRSTTVPLW